LKASCAPSGYLNHWHRHASHKRIHHMAVPGTWGVTFLRESFCLRETSWIPATSASRSMVQSSGRGRATPGHAG
jgi:hypothetical protein